MASEVQGGFGVLHNSATEEGVDHPAATPEPLLAQAPSTSPAAGVRERLALVGALLVYCMGGYYALGLSQDPLEAGELRLPIDDWIPLIPATIWCYVWVYTVMLYPVFTVRERALFRRVTLAYAVVITISLGFYALLPVTSIHLRPDLSQLDLRVFHNWGLRVNYALDPPLNLFPSLHLSIATLAALCEILDRIPAPLRTLTWDQGRPTCQYECRSVE